MRRLFGCWLLSGLFVVCAGTVAAAGPSVGSASEGAPVGAAADVSRGDHYYGIRDEAAMVIVGTFLIGLAGAVRRSA